MMLVGVAHPSDQEIQGRLYILTDATTHSTPGYDSSLDVAEVHATVLDGRAWFLFACWDPLDT